MHSVSYIIDASTLTKKALETLSERAKTAVDAGVEVEYMLYGDTPMSFPVYPLVSIVSSNITTISSFQKSIASASGERLVFTTISNALADETLGMTHQAAGAENYHIALPSRPMVGTKKVAGIRSISDLGYLIASKQFAASHITSPASIRAAIRLADKIFALQLLNPAVLSLPEVFVPHYTFLRPYVTHGKHYVRVAKIKFKNYKDRKRDIRLSKRVPTVPYDKNMPVFIILRDRVEPLKKLVAWLEEEGLKNIYLIDNSSTYPPLLSYLKDTPYEVIHLRANVGHTSPWESGAVQIYAKDQAYIVTDPDVIPLDESHGAVKYFCELLTKYPERRKAGFGLKIDDLPDHYELKNHVISWEKQFWVTEKEPEVYDAEIDTTFAVYRKDAMYVLGPGLRTGGKFVARHEPWYINSKKPNDEVVYYRLHANKVVGSWGLDSGDVSETYIQNSLNNKH